jgi:hypothetical protein
MQLKRIYNTDGPNPVLDHIKVLQHSKNQRFTQKLINRGVAEGFMTVGQGIITLHTQPQLTYKIVRGPGIYCCFDGKKLDDEKAARAYVEQNFSGQASPDKNNPAGYADERFFTCELIEENNNA